jgi:hypothetical protein
MYQDARCFAPLSMTLPPSLSTAQYIAPTRLRYNARRYAVERTRLCLLRVGVARCFWLEWPLG